MASKLLCVRGVSARVAGHCSVCSRLRSAVGGSIAWHNSLSESTMEPTRTSESKASTAGEHPVSHGAESAYAWMRLVVTLLLSTIGGVGMWSVVVALPAVQ